MLEMCGRQSWERQLCSILRAMQDESSDWHFYPKKGFAGSPLPGITAYNAKSFKE